MSDPVKKGESKVIASVLLWVPGPESTAERTPLHVVLARGAVDDYAAYISADVSDEFTYTYGNKLPFEQAVAFFPSMALEEAHYRK